MPAEKIGFRSLGVKNKYRGPPKKPNLPCILHWRQYHFVVLYKIKKNKYYIADPAKGLIALEEADFNRAWLADEEKSSGIALLLAPTPQFYDLEDERGQRSEVVVALLKSI